MAIVVAAPRVADMPKRRAFSDVFLRRWRDLVEVSWGHSTVAGAHHTFVSFRPTDSRESDPRRLQSPSTM